MAWKADQIDAWVLKCNRQSLIQSGTSHAVFEIAMFYDGGSIWLAQRRAVRDISKGQSRF